MNTRVIIAVLVILAIGGGYYYYSQKGSAAPAMSHQATSTSAGKIVPKWTFADVPQANESNPTQTKVTLTLGDTTYDGGTYAGSCSEIGANGGVDGKGLLAGELSGVQCWFAGGGDEVGLFAEEDGSMSLKHGQLDEPNGEGSTGLRGNFTDLLTI